MQVELSHNFQVWHCLSGLANELPHMIRPTCILFDTLL